MSYRGRVLVLAVVLCVAFWLWVIGAIARAIGCAIHASQLEAGGFWIGTSCAGSRSSRSGATGPRSSAPSRALRQAGRIDGVDAALVAVCRSLAAALDDAPTPYVAATIGRVQLEALRLLTGKPHRRPTSSMRSSAAWPIVPPRFATPRTA